MIVIAIIAVLIAIAIPTFAGALDNARRQTDHANIRSAYSMMQIAKMEGGVYLNGSDELTVPGTDADVVYYLQKDGTLSSTAPAKGDDTYALQADSTTEQCAASAGCKDQTHTAGYTIGIKHTKEGVWSIDLSTIKPTT